MAKQTQHPSGVPSETNERPELSAETAAPVGSRLGELLGFSAQGYPVIGRPGSEEAMEVPTTVGLGRDDVGCVVLLTFVDGREDQPVITGRLQPPLSPEATEETEEQEPETSAIAPSGATLTGDGPLKIDADGETVTIEAERELVLRCGKASLRLRRDGFVEVRGVDVVSRATRANWIRGGSVALN